MCNGGMHALFSVKQISFHQQPDVNYIQVLEKVDSPCTVNAQHLPFKGNQLRAETGQIVHFWLLVVMYVSDHPGAPDVATLFSRMAFLHETLGRYREAFDLFEKSLAILGPDHARATDVRGKPSTLHPTPYTLHPTP